MPSLAEQLGLSEAQSARLIERAAALPPHEQQELYGDLKKLEKARFRVKAQSSYLEYVRHMNPDAVEGAHIRTFARVFERISSGTLKRAIVNIAPRHSKSNNVSIYFPSWYLGKFPKKKVIHAGCNADLAVDFGSKVRDRVDDPRYRDVFPEVKLHEAKKASGHWRTNKGGEYFAIGVGGAVVGRGADLLIIDDPQTERQWIEAQTNPDIWDKTYEWYIAALTRLQPGGSVVLVQTRWSHKDLTGRILDSIKQRDNGGDWELIELPAILNEGTKDEQSLWPEFWPIEELKGLREEIKAKPGGVHLWNANYQQTPSSEESAVIKREYWKSWDIETLKAAGVYFEVDESGDLLAPKCEYIIQSWDTAYTIKQRSDYSACVTLGIFTPWPETRPDTKHIIMLNAWKGKVEFDDLKRKARSERQYWKPDTLIIESKNVGAALVDELRRSGIPVETFTPGKGQDKISQMNSVSSMLVSGHVWAPKLSWADEVIEQCARLGTADHDDLSDAFSLGLSRFRQGGFIKLPGDDGDDPMERRMQQKRMAKEYY